MNQRYPSRHGVLRFADVRLDLDAREALRGERRLELRDKTFELLACFLRHPERVTGFCGFNTIAPWMKLDGALLRHVWRFYYQYPMLLPLIGPRVIGDPKQRYLRWLRANGTGLVALPVHARPDYAAVAERRLLVRGVPGLREVWRTPD